MRDKSILPENWLAYSKMGKRVDGAPFIAFKVPLDEKFNPSIREADRFTPAHLMLDRPDLGLVVDLTNTLRYYSPEVIETCGAKHRKVACPGRVVPTANLVKRFCAIVDDFLRTRDPRRPLIGVHCTHGVNRTGYMICSYMTFRLRIPAAEAMLAFERARGYRIERGEYVEALLEQEMKETSYAAMGLRDLLRFPEPFQLGEISETPTPPDSHSEPSPETRTLPPSAAASTTSAAVSATAVVAASAECPLSALPALPPAPPPAPSDAEKPVLVRVHAPAKKKKVRGASGSAKTKTKVKVKVKKRKKIKDRAAPAADSVKSFKSEGKKAQARRHPALATGAKERPASGAVAIAIAASTQPPRVLRPTITAPSVSSSSSPSERISSTKRGRGAKGLGRSRGRGREGATTARIRTGSRGSSRAGSLARGRVGVNAPRPTFRFSCPGGGPDVKSGDEPTRPAVGTERRRYGRGGGRIGAPMRLPPAAGEARDPADAGDSAPCTPALGFSAGSAAGRSGRGRGRCRGGKFGAHGRGVTQGKDMSLSSAPSADTSPATSPTSQPFTVVFTNSSLTPEPAGTTDTATTVVPASPIAPTASPTADGISAVD